MGIYPGIAVAGEVFGAGQNALALHAAHVGEGLAGDVVFVFAKGAEVDDRVVGVVVDVHHWRVIDMDAHPFALATNLASHSFDESFVVLHCPQGHLVRKTYGAIQAHGQAPF